MYGSKRPLDWINSTRSLQPLSSVFDPVASNTSSYPSLDVFAHLGPGKNLLNSLQHSCFSWMSRRHMAVEMMENLMSVSGWDVRSSFIHIQTVRTKNHPIG